MEDELICAYCESEVSDIHNGGDPGPWWNGEDDEFKTKCASCGKEFIVKTTWSPTFETFTLEDTDF